MKRRRRKRRRRRGRYMPGIGAHRTLETKIKKHTTIVIVR